MNILKTVIILLLLKMAQPSKRSLFHIGHLTGWFTGMNICVKVQFLDDPVVPISIGHNESMRCSGNFEEYVCYVTLSDGKNLKKTFECCPGYEGRKNDTPGCKKAVIDQPSIYKSRLTSTFLGEKQETS